MAGSETGGVNVFGGVLALYVTGKIIVGAIGVSGDMSCMDHESRGAPGTTWDWMTFPA